jgi:hypothetical protein
LRSPPEDFYARVAKLAQRYGKGFTLDTSGPALTAAGRGVHLLKPSLRELEHLVGQQISDEQGEEQAVHEVIAQGRAEIVVLSLGARGALVATAQGSERVAAMPVEAKSTVGAGDSMPAGIVLGLCRDLALGDRIFPCRTGNGRERIAYGKDLPCPFAEKSFWCNVLGISREAERARPAGKVASLPTPPAGTPCALAWRPEPQHRLDAAHNCAGRMMSSACTRRSAGIK